MVWCEGKGHSSCMCSVAKGNEGRMRDIRVVSVKDKEAS